jgi:hypothetical protein
MTCQSLLQLSFWMTATALHLHQSLLLLSPPLLPPLAQTKKIPTVMEALKQKLSPRVPHRRHEW